MALWEVGSGKTYSTIQAACDALYAYVVGTTFTETQTIKVYNGTYTETVTPNAGLKPTAAFRLVITAAQDNTPVVNGSSIRAAGFSTSDISYVTLSGFIVTAVTGQGIYFTGSTFAIVTGNTCYSCIYGIRIATSTSTKVYNNISYSNTYGIYNNGTSSLEIYSNTCYSNTTAGIYSTGTCTSSIYYSNICYSNQRGFAVEASSISIYNNTVYSNTLLGISLSSSYTGLNVYNNIIYSNVGSGIVCNASSPNIYGNFIYLNTSAGITTASSTVTPKIYGNWIFNNTTSGINAGSGASAHLIYNNVIVGISPILIEQVTLMEVYNNTCYSTSGSAFRVFGTSSNNTVKNNILFNAGTLASQYCIEVGTSAMTGFISDNNDLYKTSGTANTGFWTTAQSTLANWRTASSQDAASIAADPLFVGAPNINQDSYKLQRTSPCRRIGADLSGTFTTDFYNLLRRLPWHLGAIINSDEVLTRIVI